MPDRSSSRWNGVEHPVARRPGRPPARGRRPGAGWLRRWRRHRRPPSAGRLVAARVVEQVGDHPLEQSRVGRHQREVVRHPVVDARRLGRLVRAGQQHAGDDLVDRHGSRCTTSAPERSRLRSSRLATMSVSRSVDDSIVASSSARCSARQVDIGLPESGDRGLDRRQGGAQVVTDSGEQGRSQPVDLGELPSPSRVVGERPARRGRVPPRPRAGRAGGGPRRRASDLPRPGEAPAGVDLDGRPAGHRRPDGRHGAAAGPAHQRHGRHAEVRRPPRRAPTRRWRRPGWSPAGPDERLGPAALRRGPPPRGQLDETAGRERDRQEDAERDQVVPVLDPQRVQRRDQEPVGQQEGEHAAAVATAMPPTTPISTTPRRKSSSELASVSPSAATRASGQERAARRRPGRHRRRDERSTCPPVGPAVPDRLRPPAS